MYGAWWITVPKALRRKITINGKPTVELDFSGCAIRMLYHERGLEPLWDCRRPQLLRGRGFHEQDDEQVCA